ncbi:Ferrochelatase [compost metagenome]
MEQLAEQGKKKLLVFSPAFVADCIETIDEIGVEYANEFKHLGGEEVQLVESLNGDPKWIAALKRIALDA